MPWVEQLADPQELRRCIRDLVALSTLPAIWKNYDPHQIADSVTAALLSMLSADFVHIALPGKPDEPRIEVTHVGRKVSRESVGAIQAVLRQASPGRLEHTAVIVDPLGNGQMRVATAPIGFHDDAILIAGSFQADFPTEGQRLLLGIGANDEAPLPATRDFSLDTTDAADPGDPAKEAPGAPIEPEALAPRPLLPTPSSLLPAVKEAIPAFASSACALRGYCFTSSAYLSRAAAASCRSF